MRESSTRSFSAVGGGRGGYDRGRKNRQRNILTVAIIAVMVAIIVFAVLIFMEIFDCGGKGPDGGEVNTDGSFSGISFENKLYSSSEIHIGDLILINSSFPYVFPESEPALLDLYNNRSALGTSSSGNTIRSYYTQSATHSAKLQLEALTALNAMTDDFYRATNNIDLFIYDEDGYRSRESQAEKNASRPDKYAPTGQTEHHTGKCVDLYVNVSSNEPVYKLDDPRFNSVYQWIFDNAYKYGFILRYPADKSTVTGVDNESYHFRYVGYAHAYYMYQNNLCLEEYLDFVRDNHTNSSPLYVSGDNGTEYMIYYVPASSDNLTNVSVPKEDSEGIKYSVSGDNKAGFIVTVEKEPNA